MAKELSGSLSLNTRKEKETHPDYKGSLMIGGQEYWLSGWSKTNEQGDWISLSAKPKEARTTEAKAIAPKKPAEGVPFDDTIPF